MISNFINKADRRDKSLVAVILIFFFLTIILVLSSCSTRKSAPARGIWYVLKPGETLKSVSSRFSVNLLKLRKINDIYNPDDIRAGIKIFIPAKKGWKIVKRGKPVKKYKKPRKTATKYKPPPNHKKTASYFIWPVDGTISSGYGLRHGKMHKGIDITRDGGRLIKAAAKGIVKFSGWKKGFGRTIIIDHGRGVTTLYAHNSKLYAKKGQRIRQGSVISKMGSTGTSNGIHLHFEARLKNKSVNPLRYLPVR